ncbi:hypothetical protein ACFPA8_19615 [Streptomyces ovatisporus]|uniref:Integral membrane protein n=1 Tax=Streptomyces ovatisporus TaxID=1128682 RepID=A0ABV9AA47_9ACTN
MTGSGASRIQAAQQWVWANRISLAVLLGVLWTGVMFLFVRDVLISVICGAAFTAVLAATLPRPPKP